MDIGFFEMGKRMERIVKTKAIIWGAGGKGRDFLLEKIRNYKYDIVCFVDSNPDSWGKTMFGQYNIINPNQICNQTYDVIIICSQYYDDIRDRLINELRISPEIILTYKDIEAGICNSIIERYKDSQSEDIQKALEFYKEGELNYYASYNAPYEKFSTVYRDEFDYPYILFEDKKMFFPKDYAFLIRDGQEVVPDILYEQAPESPHRYIPDGYDIPEGAVIMDAGVCEGNFALRYVERASKLYLIEADPKWMEVLKKTFEPYKNKVVFCNKFLSGRDNCNEVTIDSLVEDRLDFLKMDIEGSEVYALLGGKNTLEQNNVQCAICSYHRQYDDSYIPHILNSYGYKTYHSKGYVFFLADKYLMDSFDLRRGVIYAAK